MKKKTGDRSSKTPVSCLQETVLRQLVRIAGLHEMTIWQNRKKEWHLSVTMTQRSQVMYLSTRRACPGPSRALKRRSPRASGSGPPDTPRSCSGKRKDEFSKPGRGTKRSVHHQSSAEAEDEASS